MKIDIKLLQASTDPRFADVARIIAKGVPPKWLVIGLEQFSEFIASERTTSDESKRFQSIVEQMHDAAGKLITWLPGYSHAPIMECPDDVAIALNVSPRIKEDLARVIQFRRDGRRPNIQRQFCAGVVVEAWRLVREKFQPRSLKLYTACDEYWQICNGEVRGNLNYWREDVESAANKNNEAIREILVALRDRESGC
jgi:hypothetical protein